MVIPISSVFTVIRYATVKHQLSKNSVKKESGIKGGRFFIHGPVGSDLKVFLLKTDAWALCSLCRQHRVSDGYSNGSPCLLNIWAF